ncbi:hypothetical protein KJS94_10485 [Flavihumibacter rivuli]|uniref:hypothetical protein n=1 Tax=Flavihumibacter rivuli TaxID=2838156 RepID=UPI001BDF3584|nr:hypothetical protein [Flavihumibacter rivuli]ULQ55066.1 hypothetical protein KJS94_10485 [Flavihumibacter rivuli]
MRPFHQRFTIHPVGQGLFYSCNINHDNQVKFRMVVDCGSNTAKACQEEVSLYRDSDYLTQKTLDLLVISHFDSDHVKYIGLLLQNDIKIKRLVMPFITFEERLFLIARHISHSNGFKKEDDFALRFIIDPIGTINNNLDGDSEIYFIENNPNTPIPPVSDDPGKNDEGSNNETRFLFDFDRSAKETVDLGSLISTSSPTKGEVYKVKDTNKGKLKGSFGIHKLMEFLFYKRAVGDNEDAFFKEVKTLFNEKFAIDNSLPLSVKLKATIEKVKGMSSGTAVKAIFKDAAKNVALITKRKIKIDDLNTTALCLLHRNLKGIFDFLQIDYKGYHYYCDFYHENIRQVQKFTPNSLRLETIWNGVNGYYKHYREMLDKGHFFYPNVLLTSDTFLLTKNQVDEFLNKYQHYWNDFWLFQIPHHGSKNNSDKLLHASIPVSSYNFINYGIGNRDAHPSESVIKDLVSTGNSSRIISVNQFSGLIFEFII